MENDEPEDMLEALQTRRRQRLAELKDDGVERLDTGSPVKTVSIDGASADEIQSPSQSVASNPLNMSIRERMRNRMKNKATTLQPSTSQSLTTRKLRGLRERALPNRFDDFKQSFHSELNPQLQESIATTKEWKRLKMEKIRKQGVISEEECFQFFTASLDEVDEVQEEAKGEDELISPEPATVAINIEDSYLIEGSKPEYISLEELLMIEEQILYYPSSLPASRESKILQGTVPRNLEDEGFYVGSPPAVPKSTFNKMENRLLAEYKEDLSWFDENGGLNQSADPLRKQKTRYLLPEDFEIDPLLQLEWQKAQISSYDTRYIDEEGYQHFQIDVDISLLRFTHQSLFSKEHILETRLQLLYSYYQARKASGIQDHNNNKFEALRSSLKHLTSETPATVKRGGKLLTEEHERRVLSLRLELREPTNKQEDKRKKNEQIQEWLEEERVAFNQEHAEEIAAYEKQLLKWKKYMRMKKKQLQQSTNENGKGNTELPKVERPSPPPRFNEEEVLRNIKQTFVTSRRKPGEPYLIPELHHTAAVTPTEQCPRGEQQRRNAIKNMKYFIKVLFNDMEVSRTSARTLSTDFSLQFGEILSVKILQWPESIKLQIYETSSSNMLAEVFAPLPDSLYVSDEKTFSELEFSSELVVQYRHEGVGSGVAVQLSPNDEEPIIPLTSGVLYVHTSWGRDDNGHILAPPTQSDNVNALNTARHYDALAALGAAGMVDLQKLISWIGNANLDPNDPTNADIVNLAKMAQMTQLDYLSGPKYFRLDQLEKETEFATSEELDNNKRFKLIQMRNEGVPEFKHFQMIPTEEKFITDDVFEEYEKRLNLEEFGDPDEEFTQRKIVAKFMAKARQQVHARSQLAKRQVDLDDIVLEEAIPDIGTLGTRFAQILEPRRPLKPVRKERKKIGGQNLSSVTDVNILINIVRAFNIPVRSHQETKSNHNMQTSSVNRGFSAGQIQQQNQGYNPVTTEVKSMVRPFIEVMFQGNFLRTSVADGAWPNWNEDLVLPFKAPNSDYTTESLQVVKDKIYINLFDEVVVDILQDDRLRETNVHQRMEKRWLGNIEVPFSTVYFNSKVEGFIQVNSPPILLGYKRYQDRSSNLSLVGKDRSFIQMFITIEPQLQPAPAMPEKFETIEDDTLVHNAQVWLTDLRKKYPKRNYKTMVSDLDGKKVFLTRYIHPQKPPAELILDPEIPAVQKMKLLARFVSLLPFISDSEQFPDKCDIWTTSGQFLHMQAGDEEEHAVLLCNYFLWLQKKAYLVLGHGIPEGSTAYVLTEDGMYFKLWNASTGDMYDIQDVHCPLQGVSCLVTENNIYANIQVDELPSKMSYNIANAKLWKPFFTKSFPYPGLASVQEKEPKYFPIDNQYAINLEDKIERTLRDKLMEWRPMNITKFNRLLKIDFARKIMKEWNFLLVAYLSFDELFHHSNLQYHETVTLYPSLQDSTGKGVTLTYPTSMESRIIVSNENADHAPHLNELLTSHEVAGFPLQMSYTEINTIAERVYSTGVHLSEDPKVEFALAVHVHPYPNSVLAIWIYVGRLFRKITY